MLEVEVCRFYWWCDAMPIVFRTSLERDLVYAKWWGKIDAQTRRENYERYLSDVHYRVGRRELIDLSEVTGSDWDFAKAQTLLHQVKKQTAKAPTETLTVVWAPTDTPYGCGRMYQTLAEMSGNIRVELFREEESALEYLNLPYKRMVDLLMHESFLLHRARDGRQQA